MKKLNSAFLGLFLLLFFPSCQHNATSGGSSEGNERELTVAVVLPLSEGTEQTKRFTRIADWYLENLRHAVRASSFAVPYTLTFEWYDEKTINLLETAQRLSTRDDVFAIVGPLYSDNVQIFAEQCFSTKKPLIAPCASSESLIRSFAVNAAGESSEPFLWALTESDISQAEALLSKVHAYGGKTVALLSSADRYGQTFFDWTPFIAQELALTLVQNVRYTSENTGTDYEAGTASLPLSRAVDTVLSCGADYVICALASYQDAEPLLEARALLGDSAPQLLFTGTAYTADFLSFAENAEGVEGTAPYADPSSGFSVDYVTRFNEKPAYGEAHLYDAFLLCGFAACRCLLNESIAKTEGREAQACFSNSAVNRAIKGFIGSGYGGHSSWSPYGMIITLILAESVDDVLGDRNINGATGLLDFDAETLTSALKTVYVHWEVIDGAFVSLDFTSSDGSGRTASNRASWEWSVTFDEDALTDSTNVTVEYADLQSRWAVIVVASKGWANYRQQADGLFMYQLLKKQGYTDQHIILVMADDIASHPRNKSPGEVFARLDGENLYTDDLEIDYLLSELTANDIVSLMQGERIAVERGDTALHPYLAETPTALSTDEHADILWFWSGHGANRGGNSTLGEFVWNGSGTEGFTTELMAQTLSLMSQNRRFRKLLIIAEPCYSGSVLHVANGIDGVLAFTAANGWETSFADVYSVELKVWLSNRFTRNFTDTIITYSETMSSLHYADLYKYLVQHTLGSHVQMFNADRFENLYAASPMEFF